MLPHGNRINLGIFVGALIATLVVIQVKSEAANSAKTKHQSSLSLGKAKFSSGQYQLAIPFLEAAVNQEPQSCEAQLCLGEDYLKLKKYTQARQHLRLAVRVGHGSQNAQIANKQLMSMPKALIAPKTGKDTRMIALNLGLVSHERGQQGQATKPTVLDFCANWCQPCKQQMLIIDKAKAQYGDQINFVSIDVDDPKNDQVVDQYDVSPIPTIVFLNSDGEVVTYNIGFSGEDGLTSGLKKILTKS